MHPLEQNHADLKDVLQQQHRFEYLLDGDRAVRIHRWHRAERQGPVLQRQEDDLLQQHLPIRQSVDLRQNGRIDRELPGDEIRVLPQDGER